MLQRAIRGPVKPGEVYRQMALSARAIKREDYKKYMGGGAAHWDSRGRFQLFFLEFDGGQVQKGLDRDQGVADVMA